MSATDGPKASRREVAEALASAMERGGLSWQREWAGRWTPANAVTGRPYRGINRVALAHAGAALDTPDGRWATYRQAAGAGWPVRKGSHSPGSVEYWSRWCRTSDGRVVDERRARQLVRQGREDESILRGARLAPIVTPVFASSQLDGIPDLPLNDHTGEDPAVADALARSSRCPVVEGRSDAAYYDPAADRIVMPSRGQFKTLSGYVRVLAHEMGHATSREVGRDVSRYGSDPKARAREELVAELTSAFVSADLGVDGRADDPGVQQALANHAAYIDSWASLVRGDPDSLAHAAADASRAADAIEARIPPSCLRGVASVAMPDAARDEGREASRFHDRERGAARKAYGQRQTGAERARAQAMRADVSCRGTRVPAQWRGVAP